MYEVVELCQNLGIHYNTAYRMFRRGQIAGYQLPTGTVIIEEPVDHVAARSAKQHIVAVYARVSSSENKKNLDTQAERLITWCNAASAGRSARLSKSAAAGSTISGPGFWRGFRTGRLAGSLWSIRTQHPVSESPTSRPY